MRKCNLRNLAFSLFLAAVVAGCGGGNGGGCSSNDACAENQFCKFETGMCSGGSGSCVDRPAVCTNDVTPVCTCENLTFFNECWADAAGQSTAASGDCP